MHEETVRGMRKGGKEVQCEYDGREDQKNEGDALEGCRGRHVGSAVGR